MLSISLFSFIACGGSEKDSGSEVIDTSTEVVEDTAEEVVGNAQVRVVHLSPDAPGVDVFVNGSEAGISDLVFTSTTGFVDLPPGDYSFAVAPTGAGFDSAVPVTLDVSLVDGDVYTAIAHGYLDTSVESNAFAITPFATDISDVSADMFRVQVVHAAAASAYATVDVWNITDADNPQALIPAFDYGASVTTELPTGIAFVLGLDVDADAIPDAVFNLPDSLTGVVGLYAVNDADGTPSLIAHFEDGTSAQLNAQ